MKRVVMLSVVLALALLASTVLAYEVRFGTLTIDVTQKWENREVDVPAHWARSGITGKELYLYDSAFDATDADSSYMYVFVASKTGADGVTRGLADIRDIFLRLYNQDQFTFFADGHFEFNFREAGNLDSTAYLFDSNRYTDMSPNLYCFVRRRATTDAGVDNIDRMMASFRFSQEIPNTTPTSQDPTPVTSQDPTPAPNSPDVSGTVGSSSGGGGGCSAGLGSLALLALCSAFIVRKSR